MQNSRPVEGSKRGEAVSYETISEERWRELGGSVKGLKSEAWDAFCTAGVGAAELREDMVSSAGSGRVDTGGLTSGEPAVAVRRGASEGRVVWLSKRGCAERVDTADMTGASEVEAGEVPAGGPLRRKAPEIWEGCEASGRGRLDVSSLVEEVSGGVVV